jgi:hypothetical protein
MAQFDCDARHNWWGSAVTEDILGMGSHPRNLDELYDEYDDPLKGIVNYATWLSGTAVDLLIPQRPRRSSRETCT